MPRTTCVFSDWLEAAHRCSTSHSAEFQSALNHAAHHSHSSSPFVAVRYLAAARSAGGMREVPERSLRERLSANFVPGSPNSNLSPSRPTAIVPSTGKVFPSRSTTLSEASRPTPSRKSASISVASTRENEGGVGVRQLVEPRREAIHLPHCIPCSSISLIFCKQRRLQPCIELKSETAQANYNVVRHRATVYAVKFGRTELAPSCDKALSTRSGNFLAVVSIQFSYANFRPMMPGFLSPFLPKEIAMPIGQNLP